MWKMIRDGCDKAPRGAPRQRAHSALSMSSHSRIQQIIDHERSINRSLAPFGLALAFITVGLAVLAFHS
jgi:hypothetical protein